MKLAVRLRRRALIRKSLDSARQVPRAFQRWKAQASDFDRMPPVLGNSFPKSGTNLLLQIVRSLPRVRYYGTFLASMPSLTFRERSAATHLRLIRRIVPGEGLPAHLFYDTRYATALADRCVTHLFIYRDPRDVAVSEAYYLTHMNRWHRLHPHFWDLPDMEARVLLSIRGASAGPGFPYDYPDIAARFARYSGWLSRGDVFAMRYEDLMSSRRDELLRAMVDFYAMRCQGEIKRDSVLEAVRAGIDPSRSHTFRKGGSGGWKEIFTARLREAMNEVAGDLLIELGYESSSNW